MCGKIIIIMITLVTFEIIKWKINFLYFHRSEIESYSKKR